MPLKVKRSRVKIKVVYAVTLFMYNGINQVKNLH